MPSTLTVCSVHTVGARKLTRPWAALRPPSHPHPARLLHGARARLQSKVRTFLLQRAGKQTLGVCGPRGLSQLLGSSAAAPRSPACTNERARLCSDKTSFAEPGGRRSGSARAPTGPALRGPLAAPPSTSHPGWEGSAGTPPPEQPSLAQSRHGRVGWRGVGVQLPGAPGWGGGPSPPRPPRGRAPGGRPHSCRRPRGTSRGPRPRPDLAEVDEPLASLGLTATSDTSGTMLHCIRQPLPNSRRGAIDTAPPAGGGVAGRGQSRAQAGLPPRGRTGFPRPHARLRDRQGRGGHSLGAGESGTAHGGSSKPGWAWAPPSPGSGAYQRTPPRASAWGTAGWACHGRGRRGGPAHLPGYEVIEGQPQNRQEQEHGDGPAVPHGVHVDLRAARGGG